MRDLLLWTWVVGGAPLALVLIGRVLAWALGAAGAGMKMQGLTAGQRSASDSWVQWRHP